MSEIWAIILSAGKGTRMKTEISKQYILVDGKPVLFYSLDAFEKSKVDNIIIVAGKNDIEYVEKEVVQKYSLKKVRAIVEGGKERYNSVMNGLEKVSNEGIVLIHDGARPMIKTDQINNIIDELALYDACVAGMPVKDTIKIVDDEKFVKNTPERKYVWQIQTPQGFKCSIVKKAYMKLKEQNDNTVTDDAMVVEKYTDTKIKLVETDYANIKITTPEDIDLMKCLMK